MSIDNIKFIPVSSNQQKLCHYFQQLKADYQMKAIYGTKTDQLAAMKSFRKFYNRLVKKIGPPVSCFDVM